MARLGLTHKKRRKANTKGLLSTYDVDMSKKDMKRHGASTARRTGRFIGSWASLCLGLFSCYTAMHYVPALTGGTKMIAVSNAETASARLDIESDSVLSPYVELFKLRRTYLRAGQSIQAQYNVPEGGQLNLRIVKCANAVVIEVFNCQPVGAREVTVTDSSGSREFRFAKSGFYHFYDKLEADSTKDYRVVWKRG